MELSDLYYAKDSYIETASGNKVNRHSVLCGSHNIVLNGKTIIMSNCIIRGDLANVRIGRHCVISHRAVIRPPFKKFSKGVAFFPQHIGDHVFIESDSVVNAAQANPQENLTAFCIYSLFHHFIQVGSYVHIGRNCVIGRRCVLKDACAILDDTVLPPETVVPPFTIFGGSPGRFVSELPECTPDLMANFTKQFYIHFKSTISSDANVGGSPISMSKRGFAQRPSIVNIYARGHNRLYDLV
ncbi:unnamed protein product [Protopolystoma xenopodis]|uniref:Dynactin subunit 5 n=1 Tax=Protopolystoma xenopodis TaxID=117903 RepID=A0A3S5A1E4_9PLAT|nr:unnamed protein product [Protopolystoma xenopodis]